MNIVFAVTRNGLHWSVRVDNGHGIAIELPCRNRFSAELLVKQMCAACLRMQAGYTVEWRI